MKALYVRCARGALTKMLWEKGYNSFDIDIDEEKIEYDQKHFSTKTLSFHIQDATKLEFPDRFFDLVLCLQVIEQNIDGECRKEEHQ